MATVRQPALRAAEGWELAPRGRAGREAVASGGWSAASAGWGRRSAAGPGRVSIGTGFRDEAVRFAREMCGRREVSVARAHRGRQPV